MTRSSRHHRDKSAELEYLFVFEVIPPEMQEYAEPISESLRRKLAAATS